MRSIFRASREEETQSVQPLGRQYRLGHHPTAAQPAILANRMQYSTLQAGRNKRSFLSLSQRAPGHQSKGCLLVPPAVRNPIRPGGQSIKVAFDAPQDDPPRNPCSHILVLLLLLLHHGSGGWARSFWNLLPVLLLLLLLCLHGSGARSFLEIPACTCLSAPAPIKTAYQAGGVPLYSFRPLPFYCTNKDRRRRKEAKKASRFGGEVSTTSGGKRHRVREVEVLC
ncbi:hypothetical protein PAHAL_1G053800 [Panicum hallii]|uniref:Uncharacterized protein n=1 Tax=Panicum hallii TaxID=206008 RepID=A0A2S3GLK9_9POAL|nr:hypothetical protein PAHAL_1G053800 [Panicum hallii]